MQVFNAIVRLKLPNAFQNKSLRRILGASRRALAPRAGVAPLCYRVGQALGCLACFRGPTDLPRSLLMLPAAAAANVDGEAPLLSELAFFT